MKKIFILFTLMCTLWKAEGQNNITQAEYFVDTDPGRGKATPITIPTPSTNVKNVPFTVSLSGLSEGFHRVYMRTYSGRWSHTSSSMIYKMPSSTSLKKITGAEYFIDTDPGRGKGKSINITSDFDVSNASFNLSLNTLSEGFHRLYLRTRDGNGAWSHTSSYMFYKLGLGVSDTTIVQAEYFIDNDPGHGKATAIPVTAAKKLTNVAFSLPLSALSEGFHRLYIRTRDANKRWSLTNTQMFYKYVVAKSDTTITQVEYFVDNDPGLGKATQVNVAPGKNIVNKEFTLPLNNLSMGFHRLYIRSKDGFRKWSHTNSIMFYKYAPPADTALVQMEYFIDTDPGHGKAIPVVMNPATRWKDSIFRINITGLSTGTHRFYLRTRSNSGKWSLTNTDTFRIGNVPPAPAIVVSKFSQRGLCAGDKFNISFHSTGSYTNGNIYKAQLSDKNGNFSTNPPVIGSVALTAKGAIMPCKLPTHVSTGNRYRVRIVSTAPVVIGVASVDSLVINDRPIAPLITGDSNVNVNISYSYLVNSNSGSKWVWSATDAVVVPNKNSAVINWNKTGTGKVISIVETSKFGCLGDTGTKVINVYAPSIDTVKILNLNSCPGNSSTVTAKVTGAYPDSNVFKVELSNATGGFGSPILIGTLTAGMSGVNQPLSVPVQIPGKLPNGTAYKVRIVASSPSVISQIGSGNLSVVKPNIGKDTAVKKCEGSAANLTVLYNTTGLTVSWNVSRPDSVVAAGSYRLIVTNSRGCKDTAIVTVTNYAKTPVGPDTTVYACRNAASIRNVYDLTNFTVIDWGTSTPDSAVIGSYSLIVANNLGCRDTAVIKVACPLANGLSTKEITSISASATWKFSSCNVQYQVDYRKKGTTVWSTGTTSDTSVNLTGLTASTDYQWRMRTICRSAPISASAYSTVMQFKTATTVAKPYNSEIAFIMDQKNWYATVYPNPAKDMATLQVKGITNYYVMLSNAEGKMLWQSQKIKSPNVELPVGQLPAGLYFITITDKDLIKTLRLVIGK